MSVKFREPVRERVINQWPAILRAAGVDESCLIDVHGPCPLCCDGQDRFRFDDKDGRGTYFCNACGPGDGFQFLMKFLGLSSFKEAAVFIEGVLDGSAAQLPVAPVVARKPKDDEEERERIREKLQKAWNEARPIQQGDTAWTYLTQTRRLVVEHPAPMIRLHPGMKYWNEVKKDDGTKGLEMLGRHPVMLTKVTAPDGRPVGLHRTFLAQHGEKAPVPKPKKLMGGLGYSGGAIRLFPATDVLGLAEGIETAFAAHSMYDIPVWATVSATMLEAVVLPEAVRKVVIFADNDPPDDQGRRAGQDAAAALAVRLRSEGREVEIKLPPKEGTDFHDVYCALLDEQRLQVA